MLLWVVLLTSAVIQENSSLDLFASMKSTNFWMLYLAVPPPWDTLHIKSCMLESWSLPVDKNVLLLVFNLYIYGKHKQANKTQNRH